MSSPVTSSVLVAVLYTHLALACKHRSHPTNLNDVLKSAATTLSRLRFLMPARRPQVNQTLKTMFSPAFIAQVAVLKHAHFCCSATTNHSQSFHTARCCHNFCSGCSP